MIAYGQTGSGKTHTILGPGWDDPENITTEGSKDYIGVMPRIMHTIFDYISESANLNLVYDIKSSFIEIYNEKI